MSRIRQSRVVQWLVSTPARHRLFCLAAFGALVVLPVALTAARSASFSASVQAFPVEQAFAPHVSDPASYVRRLLHDPLVMDNVAATAGFPVDSSSLPAHVRITPAKRSAVITARGNSPERARLLADAFAGELANASARDLTSTTASELSTARRELAAAGSAGKGRFALQRRVQELGQLATRTRFGLVMGPRPSAPQPTTVVDRLLNRLPGALPPRPSLAWVGLAGLLASVLICGAVLFRAPRGRSRWLGAWLLPLSREERADVLTFAEKSGDIDEEELALSLVKSKEGSARQWQDIVREYTTMYPPTRRRARVLLFGCDAGDEALLLAEAGYELTLADTDPATLDFVVHRLRRRDLSARVVPIDPHHPAIEGLFDAIFVSALRGEGLDRSAAAAALRAALRPGAMLVEKRPPPEGRRRGESRRSKMVAVGRFAR
jgi:hypothetical protein